MPHTESHERPAQPRRGGIELSTLFVAGLAAVIAAYVVSKLWAPGTVWATAFTPVIVSVIKEALERPAQTVSRVATRAVTTPRTVDHSAPPPPVVVDHDAELSDELSERKVYGRRTGSRLERRWKIAIATGLLAFVGVVALFTLPELVAGKSVTSSSHDTTFFGGRRSSSSSSTTKTETSTTSTSTKTTTGQTTSTPTTTTTTPTTSTPTTTTTTPAQTTTTPAPSAAPPATTTTTPATP